MENEAVRAQLEERAVEDIFEGLSRAALVSHPWEIHDFSSCFSLERGDGGDPRGIYVKIPKIDVRRQTVAPETEGDRRLGRAEFESLSFLKDHWPGDLHDVRFVEPLAFYDDLNAIVTRRFYADELYERFRSEDLRGRIVNPTGERPVEGILRRIGATLREFQRSAGTVRTSELSIFRAPAVLDKMERAGAFVAERSGSGAFVHCTLRRLRTLPIPEHRHALVPTLKGLDVRNMFVAGDRVHLLDPGKLKPDAAVADLARLIVTCRILYWGSTVFFARLAPASLYEVALIRGYGLPDDSPERPVLRLLILKELFKHWRAAYTALGTKRWPLPTKWFLGRFYIDPFYRREVSRELGALLKTLPVSN